MNSPNPRDTLIARLRDRFQQPSDEPRFALLRRGLRFLGLSIRKAHEDNLVQQSAALAFTTIISLIPLLAAISFLGAQWFNEQTPQTIALLSTLLPYSEETIVTQLEAFLEQAKAIRGFGFAAFVLTALGVFTTIEKTINRIWNVPQSRPLKSRLLSFTLLLFWGPLVIGTTYSLLFYLRQQPALQSFSDSLPAELLPSLVTCLGLTMLYWQVPYTEVRFRSAFAGGVLATLLLEVLRQGFGLYVEHVRTLSLVYGSFGLALLFMLSIQLTWWTVLLGSEAAYCLQHAESMTRSRRRIAPAEGSWIALTALALLTRRFRRGAPLTPPEILAEHLRIDTRELEATLAPLFDHGLLQRAHGETEGYLLSHDPHTLRAAQIFEIYETLHWNLLAPLPEDLSDPLERLRALLTEARDTSLETLTLAQLIEASEPPDAITQKAS